MNEIARAGSTTWVRHPTWSDGRFADPTAQSYWDELRESLQRLALAEIAAGNGIVQILRNSDRGVVLLEFERGPLVESRPPGVIVHSEHRYGNYCYDGTRCTYEDGATGSFLAFNDPNWPEPSGNQAPAA